MRLVQSVQEVGGLVVREPLGPAGGEGPPDLVGLAAHGEILLTVHPHLLRGGEGLQERDAVVRVDPAQGGPCTPSDRPMRFLIPAFCGFQDVTVASLG